MSTKVQFKEFSSLFKLYRLHSGIGTLKEFSDLMEREGIFYDVSIYTRWQQGERVPTERKTILAMIRIFLRKESLSTIEDINRFMKIAGQENVSLEESDSLLRILQERFNSIPQPILDFVGRVDLLKDINWQLLTYDLICIEGTPGSGKTSFVIHLANNLSTHFKDGIFYYRSDIEYIETILIDIAKCFGEDISQIKNIDDKFSFVGILLRKKQVLVILDNIENYNEVKTFVEKLRTICKLVLVSQHIAPLFKNSYHINLPPFTNEEVIMLATIKLGNEYVINNRELLHDLGKQTANSPLALSILFSYIYTQQVSIEEVINKIDKWLLPLTYQITHDNRTIASSLDLITRTLSLAYRNVLYSFSMFTGKDVDIEALAAIQSITLEHAYTILNKLIELSLVERLDSGRYQVHPLTKSYLKQHSISSKWYKNLANYFINLEKVDDELDNLKGVFEYCAENNLYEYSVLLWNNMAVFLVAAGRWQEISKYEKILDKYTNKDRLKSITIIFIFVSFFALWLLAKDNSLLLIIFSSTYCITALVSLLYGLIVSKKWTNVQSSMNRALVFFSLGLLAQTFGQLSYSVIYIIHQGQAYVYPSIGDIGYFGSIPLYIYGSILLARAIGLSISLKSVQNKIQSVLIPLIIVILYYYIFLQGYIFDWSKPLNIFLDFGYPLGQAIYISLAILVFLLTLYTLGGAIKRGVLFILFALLIQYIADFMFLYQFNRGLWNAPANTGDLIYLLAYAMMGIALLQFDYTYKLKQPNNTDLFTKVKKYIFSTT